MTNTEERLLPAYPAAHGDIYGQDDDAGFGVWKAVHATPELEVEYKHVLEAGAGVAGPVSGRISPALQCRLLEAVGYLGR